MQLSDFVIIETYSSHIFLRQIIMFFQYFLAQVLLQGEVNASPCNDVDNDGVTDCAGDCDDSNADVTSRSWVYADSDGDEG